MDGWRNGRRTRARRGLTALLVTLVVMATGTAPAGAQTAPFNTNVAQNVLDPGGTPNGVVVVGDDNLIAQGVTSVASIVTNVTGASSWVSAAGFASWMTYFWPGQQNNNATMSAYADLFDARLSVGALAMNDARLITQYPASYNASIHRSVMAASVDVTLDHSECVMLVNMQTRSGVPGVSVAAGNAVNASMQAVATANPGRVFVADWKSYSAGQSAWFQPGSALLSATGATAFALFVAVEADDLIDDEGC